jgi:glycerol kinase
VVVVPAFTGLGAPWWDAEARGAIFGLTRDAGLAEIAAGHLRRLRLPGRDLIEAMRADAPSAFDRDAAPAHRRRHGQERLVLASAWPT